MGGRRGKYFIIFGIICIGICLFMANDAIQANEKYGTFSSTLYVGGTGAGNYSKIQDAIDNASNGDTIFVYSGIYYENVVINKSINLIGENKNTTIIDGNNTGDVVYVTANNVSIRNFTIRNSGNNWRDSGIKIRSSFNHISGCNILDCYDGIYTHFSYSSNNTISSCNIYLNNIGIELVYFSDYNNISYCQLHLNGIGIDITNSHYNTIFNCHIHSNNGTGIWNGYSDNTTIFQSYIHSNNGTGIWNGYSDNTTIFQSYIHSNNGTGIWNGYSEGNIIYWNTISNNSYGIYAVFSYNNKIFHNNFINNTVQAYDNGNNTWDNGYPMGGNYWSNFTSPDNKHGYYQNLSGFDLLVDYPYNISGGSNKDRWPHTIKDGWMKPLFVPNIILVEFKQNVSNSTINATIANYGTEIIEYLRYVNVYLLNITADNQSEFDTYYMFNNDTNVLWACLDLYEYLAAKPEHLTTPNDPCYPKQWHLNNYGINPGVPTGLIDADIDAPQAWEHLTDCRKDWNGNDFVIAIIDSGVDLNHPDIVANLWTNPNEQIGDANGDGFPGVGGVDDDGDGLTDFDDYHRILARETNIDEDDDEDGIVNEDPVNGIDDDGDGRKDEDPPGDANGDGFPGVKGVDDDGDGKADYNDNNYLAFIRANYQFHNDDDENGVVDDIHGADFVDMDGSPDDENGHGTHCAGIICAHGNNGIGVTGVCWRAQLMVLRTFDASGRGSFSSFEKCIDYVIWAKNHSINVKVVSYSGGGSGNAILKQNAINKLHKKKILFVCAAGNDGRDLDDPANPWDFYPAECTNPNIIAVAASDNQDKLVTRANWGWGSNWGTTSVDIVAPGQHIFSLGLSQRYNQPEGIYRDINNIGIVSADDIRLSSLPTYGTGPVGANDADVGLPLILFNPDEKHTVLEPDNGQYDPGEIIYKDIVNPANNRVDVGDIRLTSFRAGGILYRAGSVVRIWDPDVGLQLQGFNSDEKHTIYCYKSGTSMATPMVTGEVARFWCQFPNLNHLQVKEWILKKVDPRASLQNTVVSGINHDGRLRMISGFDFGDAPDPFKGVNHRYPTVLDDDNGTGASHEDIGEEWLGWDVSPEYDANVNATPPYDVDGTPNLWPPRVPPNPHPPYAPGDIPDLDVHDDGVFLPMVVFRGGVFPIEFHIQTENPFIDDADSGRYDEFRAVKRDEKKIYINAFFDWNNDGDWDDINEPLIKCPALVCTWWGGPNMTCCYGIFWPSWQWLTNIFPFLQPLVNLLNENAYRRTTFTVPWNAELGETWVRVRLDYGENAGLPPYPRYDSDFPFATPLIDTYRHAQFGEVEDYWLYIINKTKVVGEPKYYDGEITWVTSYTPIQIIDEPEPPYPVFNYYRLWYGEWSPWIEYNDTFYLEGEGLHYIEYYGKVVENNKTIFYDGFNDDSRWVAIDLDGFAYTWEWTNITPEWINGTFEGYFMLFDQYAVGELEIPNHDSLISAPISCSMFNNTMLYFDGMFNTTGNEKLWINVSTISGEYMQWTNVLTLEENSSGPWLINISSIADGNIIAINFTYSSPYGTGYGALIDNVYIYGDVITYSPVYNQSHIVDDTPPTAIINAITPYNQTSIPFEITYNASDDACGLKEVWLYFRYSYDNSTWSDWLPYAKSNNGEWIFHAPYAPAYYEFYSMAVDNLGNAEAYDGIEAMAYVPLQT
ncbi:MAG TPA: hypothetical protein ENI33_01905, partial [Thermoplasmatales archaeon]|nr:hypothetical protein [Thermoplasmatales archaeon]